MAKKSLAANSSFSTNLFLAFLIPSVLLAFIVIDNFNLVGLPFLLILLLMTLWLSLFCTSVISLYTKGNLLWGNVDDAFSSEVVLTILIVVLVGLVAVATHMVPEKLLKASKKNLVTSFGAGALIPTISIFPYVIFVWVFLIFIGKLS